MQKLVHQPVQTCWSTRRNVTELATRYYPCFKL